jgi:glycosyltransferase involved in cell wall biosynthesis
VDAGGELSARARAAGLATLPLRCRYAHDLVAGLSLRRLAQRHAPDVVHFHTARALSLAPYVPRPMRRIVTRRMDYPPRGAAGYVRWLYGQMDAVIAISRAVRDALASRGIPASAITVVPSGVDTARFAPTDSRAARSLLGVPDDVPVVAIVASLHPRKGHAFLLEALAELAARGVRPLCLVAGTGPEGQALLERTEALGLASQLRWLGALGDVRPVFAAADVIVLPSLAEGLGVAAIEAMASGRPVVASAVGGIPELIRDGVEGLLVPAGDAHALATALERALVSAELRHSLGAAGRTRADSFSTRAMAEGTAAVYERAVARGAG